MTEAGWTGCGDCGMPCASSEYHPYAACLMFKHCRDSETVRANLQAVRQQGKVEGIQESKNLVSEFIEAWLLAGMVAKLLTPAVHEAVGGLSRDLRRELQKIEQAAQDEKGVGDGNTKG